MKKKIKTKKNIKIKKKKTRKKSKTRKKKTRKKKTRKKSNSRLIHLNFKYEEKGTLYNYIIKVVCVQNAGVCLTSKINVNTFIGILRPKKLLIDNKIGKFCRNIF